MEVRGLRVSSGKKQLVKPVGIDCWLDTKEAVGVLLTGYSSDESSGKMFENVVSNYCLVAIVTGFEQTLKTLAESNGKRITDVNFQDLNQAKKFYKDNFGITLSQLCDDWSLLSKVVSYTHRIRHASPLLTILNEFDTDKEKPIFVYYDLVNKVLPIFDGLIVKVIEQINVEA